MSVTPLLDGCVGGANPGTARTPNEMMAPKASFKTHHERRVAIILV